MSTSNLPLATRKAAFHEIVDAEDGGQKPTEARKKIAEKYHLSVEEIRAITEEGIDKSWPPLEPCEENEPGEGGAGAAAEPDNAT